MFFFLHRERVAVSVNDNGDGTMSTQVEYDHAEGAENAPPVFTNKMKPGELTITKTLNRIKEGDTATFVFQVEGVDDNGNTVYSNVTSLDFDAIGTRSVTLHDVPIGAKVTVTEVYSGSSYHLTANDAPEVVILSPEAEGAPVGVSFTNDYDVTDEGGYGVLNRYGAVESGEGYAWQHMDQAAQLLEPTVK